MFECVTSNYGLHTAKISKDMLSQVSGSINGNPGHCTCYLIYYKLQDSNIPYFIHCTYRQQIGSCHFFLISNYGTV